MQEIGTPVTYIHSLLRYMRPDIHDDIWAPHRALDDGTLGPGSSTLHTWAKVHHPAPLPWKHTPSPHALCYQDTDTPKSTNTDVHRQGRRGLGKDACTVVLWHAGGYL